MAKQQQAYYQAYLLRLWRDHDHAEWRVSLQHATTKEQIAFPSLVAAFNFLEQQVGQKGIRYVG